MFLGALYVIIYWFFRTIGRADPRRERTRGEALFAASHTIIVVIIVVPTGRVCIPARQLDGLLNAWFLVCCEVKIWSFHGVVGTVWIERGFLFTL